MIVALLLGMVLFGLFLRQIGKTLEHLAKDQQQRPHYTHTTIYNDNRQYHHTEVYNHERIEQPADNRDFFQTRI